MAETPFLACAAIPGYWDLSKPLVFLHAGCHRYSQRVIVEEANAITLPSPFSNAADFPGLHEEFAPIYETLLKTLGSTLNRIHRADHSGRYWRIMLGPWLMLWLVAFLERFKNLHDAFARFPQAVTHGIERSCRPTSFDTLAFARGCGDDLLNLGIYSGILEHTNSRALVGMFTAAQTAAKTASPAPRSAVRPLIRRALDELLRFSYKTDWPRHDVIVVDGRLLNRQSWPMWTGSRLKAWPLIPWTFKPPVKRATDQSARATLADALTGAFGHDAARSPLISTAAALTAAHLPDVFLESYAALCSFSERLYPRKPRAVFSTNHLFFDEAYKHWAAKSCGDGAKIIHGQHGGNEAFCAYDPICAHDLTVPDLFCGWGDPQKPRAPGQCFGPPIGLPKIIWRRNSGTKDKFMLFGSTHTFRYQHILVPLFSPARFATYLERQKRFAAALDKSLKARLKVRVLYDDLGWDMHERWQDWCPQAQMDDPTVPFGESIATCGLYVCDHLMTTYIQSLQANVPTVLFWDDGDYAVPAEGAAALADLREAGILHASPEAAADTINREFWNIETWWYARHRQDARARFVQAYAPLHDNPLGFWGKKLTAFVRENVH